MVKIIGPMATTAMAMRTLSEGTLKSLRTEAGSVFILFVMVSKFIRIFWSRYCNGYSSGLLMYRSAVIHSFQRVTMQKRPMVAMPGFQRGMIREKKILYSLAPSMYADSMIASGISDISVRRIKMFHALTKLFSIKTSSVSCRCNTWVVKI